MSIIDSIIQASAFYRNKFRPLASGLWREMTADEEKRLVGHSTGYDLDGDVDPVTGKVFVGISGIIRV